MTPEQPHVGGEGHARWYLAAVAASAVALLVAGAIAARLGTDTLLPGVMAVAVSAWVGGAGPALAATVLCLVGFAAGVIPSAGVGGVPSLGEALRLALFAATGIAISVIGRSPRRARERAEAALRVSEERARLALDAARLGTFEWEVGEDGGTGAAAAHRWDARTREIYGFAPDEPITLALLDARIHPEDREAARAAFERLSAPTGPTGDARRLESSYRVMHPDGTVRVLELRGRLTFAGSGAARRPARLVGTVLDVSDRAAAAEALREQLELLDTILAATDDLVFAKDRAGRYLVMNPAGARLHGRTVSEIVGHTDDDIFPPALAAELRANDARVLAGGTTLRFEESTVAGGERRVYQSTKSVYRDAEGRPAGVVGVSTDITDRVRAEEALRESNAELAQTTYTIAHDLRSPLRSMHGYASLLAREYASRLDARGHDYLERVQANAVRMGQLVDGVLALAKLGRATLRVERVDLSALARAVVDDLARAEPERRVVARIADGLVAPGDPRLLALVMQNLLTNAWKFTRDREPARIEVDRGDPGARPGGSAASGDALVVVVRDNGVGFDPEFAGQLFRPFHRLHTDAEFEGTGIGLATVRRVVERHGGRAWAEGALGRGAAVHFALPFTPTLAPPAPEPVP